MAAQISDFDWEKVTKRGIGGGYSADEKAKLEALYSETLANVTEKDVVMATVVSITDREVLLNIGFKSDGLVSTSEFRDLPNLAVGDTVEVFIEKQEDAMGQLVISRKKARVLTAWSNIEKSFTEDAIIDALVKRRTKGGLIVDIYGIEAFLPGSQIDVKPIRDFDIFVGKKMEVKVVKINHTNDNVVVSHKILIEKDLETQRQVILTNLEKGQVLEGVVKNITNFGVFIDLGGVDGLLHITDISWGRINHPNELLKLDQRIKVVVLDFDEEKKRISLGMKQLENHPWDSLAAELSIGSRVKGKIVNIADYGAFLELKPGVEGLIHVSEMSWSQHLRNPSDFLKIGDEIEAVVLTLDRDDRKMSLGIKQLTEDPWTKQDLINKYAVNTKHTGTVRNMTNFGIFLELEEGIDGLVHVSDLSWTKKIKHPSDFVKVGDALEVMVLELDGENRRLALSHKHLEENPWDTFEHIFTVNSGQECTIISKNDKQATLELPYGIEGYALLKHLAKADGTVGEVGEKLTFQVLEFHKEEKKIMLSHSKTWEVVKEEAPKEAKKKGGKEASTTSSSNNNEEKSTLGDLSALSALKDAMVEGEKKKLSKKKDAAVETAAVETAPVETAPVETAPVETAPVENASVATAAVAAATETVAEGAPAVEEVVAEVAPEVDATPAADATTEA
jgi:small subunit ribosomal protein S1